MVTNVKIYSDAVIFPQYFYILIIENINSPVSLFSDFLQAPFQFNRLVPVVCGDSFYLSLLKMSNLQHKVHRQIMQALSQPFWGMPRELAAM